MGMNKGGILPYSGENRGFRDIKATIPGALIRPGLT